MQNLNFPKDSVNERLGGKKRHHILKSHCKKINHVCLGYNGV